MKLYKLLALALSILLAFALSILLALALNILLALALQKNCLKNYLKVNEEKLS